MLRSMNSFFRQTVDNRGVTSIFFLWGSHVYPRTLFCSLVINKKTKTKVRNHYEIRFVTE